MVPDVIESAVDEPGPAAVFFDNVSSHLNHEVIELAEKHKIMLIPLPPNSTHLTQPCDVAIFRPLKKHWRVVVDEACTEAKREGRRMPATLPCAEFAQLFKKAMDMWTHMPGSIVSGFRKTGIYPFCPEKVLSRM